MKIAVTTRFVSTHKMEGVGHHTYELLQRLINNHPEIEWHLINEGKKDQVRFTQNNVVHHKLSPPTRHPLLWYYWYEWSLPQLLDRIRPDVIWYPDGIMSLKANVPSLLTIHDLAYLHFPEGSIYSHRRYLQWLMPRQVQKANHIACVSNFTLKDVRSSFGISEDKLSVVYNAANEKFRPYSIENQLEFRKELTTGKPYFLYLGALHPRKNIIRLIQAYDLYRSKNEIGPKLVLAGRIAWKSNKIRNTLEGANSRNDIIHVSEIDDIIHPLIASAQALVYISLWEGFGMPVLEAMQSGVPIITSKDSPMEEVAENSAIYVDPYNVESIQEGMHKATLQKGEEKNLNPEGIRKAKNFNWRLSAKQLYEILISIRK